MLNLKWMVAHVVLGLCLFGGDCSVPSVPMLTEMEILCDWRTTACKQINLTASPLTSDLKCRWKELESITKQETGIVYTTNSTLISNTKTLCTVPDLRSQALNVYNFSITTDGQTFSQEKEITLFDSKCKQCDTSGSCSSKPNTCVLEDGKCYDGLICTACDNAISIGHPKRSSAYQTKSTDVFMCDAHRITKGYYYWFDQYTGHQIPETCVDGYHCSTIHPVWLNGTHPTEEEPVKESEVCANMNSDCCHWRDNVTIRYCKTLSNVTFYAYQLPPTPFCNLAYCCGSTMPCNESTQWDASTNQCVDINECLSNPCVNGNCTNLQGKFECQCEPGYAGTRCNENTIECSSNPCTQGSCTDMVNGYQCRCSQGYTGNNCDQNIDECASNPCGTNGECVDSVNKYTCTCDNGYTGLYCTEGSSSGKGSGPGAIFDVRIKNRTAIETNKTGLKVAMANSINTYCIKYPNACCTAIDVSYNSNRNIQLHYIDLTSSSMISILIYDLPNVPTINLDITVYVTSHTARSFCQDPRSLLKHIGSSLKMTNLFISKAIYADKGKIFEETGIEIISTNNGAGSNNLMVITGFVCSIIWYTNLNQ